MLFSYSLRIKVLDVGRRHTATSGIKLLRTGPCAVIGSISGGRLLWSLSVVLHHVTMTNFFSRVIQIVV